MPSSEAIACRSASGLASSAERVSTDMGSSWWVVSVGVRPALRAAARRLSGADRSAASAAQAAEVRPSGADSARIHFRRVVVGVEARQLGLAGEHAADAQEVDGRGDVVHAHDRRAVVGGVADGGQRPGQALGRRAARDRGEEVLARHRRQPRVAELAQRVDRRAATSTVSAGRLGEVRARVDDELVVRARRARGASAQRSRHEGHDVADDVAAVVGEVLLLGRRARVHDHQRRAGARRTRRPAPGRAGR